MFLHSITKSEKTLKIDNIVVNKKEIHKSKQSINLDLINYNNLKKKIWENCASWEKTVTTGKLLTEYMVRSCTKIASNKCQLSDYDLGC